MAGTDYRNRDDMPQPGPAVILVEPQMGENIGAAARAMLNCSLTQMRLVKPRDGWPNPAAVANSAGAAQVIDHVQVFETTAEAIADLNYVYATTARSRGMIKPIVTPPRAAEEMSAHINGGARCGILFGCERSGLNNDDTALADTLITVPLNPAFSSLNLGQAVLLLGYEWFKQQDETQPAQLETNGAEAASKADFDTFFTRLEGELETRGFFFPPDKKPVMVRNLRNLFLRIDPTTPDLKTLHGVLSALIGKGKYK